jgi:hypothetical protein
VYKRQIMTGIIVSLIIIFPPFKKDTNEPN